jgi:TusA-related sulfurtransferase
MNKKISKRDLKRVDVRGLGCPEPVLKTIQAAQEPGNFEVIVDSETARENILRVLRDKFQINAICENSEEGTIIRVSR